MTTNENEHDTPLPPRGEGLGGRRIRRRVPQQAHSSTPAPAQTAPTPTSANSPSPHKGEGLQAPQARAKRLRAQPTRYEKRLWDILRAKRPGGTHWRRQVVIAGYSFDFGCHGLKLLVEVDGGVHNLPDVQRRDDEKAKAARAHGYQLIRIPNEQVMDIETSVYFDQFVAQAESSPTPTPPHKGEGLRKPSDN
jgi:very-short-patch-repair endonuclease